MSALLVAVSMGAANGCSRLPRGPEPTVADGDTCAARAIELYDANGDGAIGAEELAKSPPLKAALSRIDADGDGKLAASEIAKPIDGWRSSRTVISPAILVIKQRGAPLAGATVSIEPEPFLEGLASPAQAVTDARGEAMLTGQHEKFPGAYAGWYRVRVSKQQNGRELIPPRYNAETTIGIEVPADFALAKLYIDVGK